MKNTISLNPVTRIEGHLAVKIETEAGRVVKAFVSGEMFRGFEIILRGRDPLDAQQITQRICGVCPVEHGVASVLAQEMVYGITPPANGRLVRNLIQGANFIMSHLSHFYLLSGLDFVDVAMITQYQGKEAGLLELRDWVKSELAAQTVYAAAPFLPRFTASYISDKDLNLGVLKHYLEAFEMRRLAHQLGAVFSGKLPHAATLVPGGVTDQVTAIKIAEYKSLLARLQRFINDAYLPDILAVAGDFPEYFKLGKSHGNFLAYGVFPESADNSSKLLPPGVFMGDQCHRLDTGAITEDVRYSWFSSASCQQPSTGETIPAPTKAEAYSWLKAPRYQGQAMEVGALARVLIACQNGQPAVLKSLAEGVLKSLGKDLKDLNSVMGRHAARALECKIIADRCADWVEQLVPGEPACIDLQIPDTGQGYGLTEAARGALGHWLEIKGHKIARYQCVVPTTWNCSPNDDRGLPGAMEQALVGTPIADPANPIEAARVIRSFDPCIACAVH